jgi:hypothetical protein
VAWWQLLLAIPAGLLVFALIHDFFAGLADERLWSDPGLEDRS